MHPVLQEQLFYNTIINCLELILCDTILNILITIIITNFDKSFKSNSGVTFRDLFEELDEDLCCQICREVIVDPMLVSFFFFFFFFFFSLIECTNYDCNIESF